MFKTLLLLLLSINLPAASDESMTLPDKEGGEPFDFSINLQTDRYDMHLWDLDKEEPFGIFAEDLITILESRSVQNLQECQEYQSKQFPFLVSALRNYDYASQSELLESVKDVKKQVESKTYRALGNRPSQGKILTFLALKQNQKKNLLIVCFSTSESLQEIFRSKKTLSYGYSFSDFMTQKTVDYDFVFPGDRPCKQFPDASLGHYYVNQPFDKGDQLHDYSADDRRDSSDAYPVGIDVYDDCSLEYEPLDPNTVSQCYDKVVVRKPDVLLTAPQAKPKSAAPQTKPKSAAPQTKPKPAASQAKPSIAQKPALPAGQYDTHKIPNRAVSRQTAFVAQKKSGPPVVPRLAPHAAQSLYENIRR